MSSTAPEIESVETEETTGIKMNCLYKECNRPLLDESNNQSKLYCNEKCSYAHRTEIIRKIQKDHPELFCKHCFKRLPEVKYKVFCNAECSNKFYNKKAKEERMLNRATKKKILLVKNRLKKEEQVKKDLSAHRTGVITGDCGDSYFQ